MSNILYFIVVISFLIYSEQSWSQSEYLGIESTPADSVVYEPGFFRWSDNTVITPENAPSSQILQYQEILDHTNTNFSERPESLILLRVDTVSSDELAYVIAISQDTIQVAAPSVNKMNKALRYLRKMKEDAKKETPDYGLIFLRCGTYLTNNF